MLIREIFQARPPVLDLVLTLLTDINMYSYNCINIALRHTAHWLSDIPLEKKSDDHFDI